MVAHELAKLTAMANEARLKQMRMIYLLCPRRYPFVAYLARFIFLAVLLLLSPSVMAHDYGLFIEVEDEEDLLDLLSAQEIDQTQFDSLVELLNDGVDLNEASRDDLYALPNLSYAEVDAILAYRDDAGNIDDPLSLVAADVLSEKKLMAIAPFLLLRQKTVSLYDTKGRVRYRSTYVAGDKQVPSMWLSGKVSTFRNLDVGVVGVLTRNRISDVVYDPNRDALSAMPASVQIHVPKFYLQWETKSWNLVAGTYRIGFGQRLTFDNTTWYSPNGIKVDETINYNQDLTRSCRESSGELDSGPCSADAANQYTSPDYRWTDRLRGIAIGLKRLDLGEGWAQAYAWFSFQTKNIYQYEVYDRRFCDDPSHDSDPACRAPDVFVRQDDLLAAAPRFSYQTLPGMYNEMLGGANATYFFSRRSHLGVTGYGSAVSWLVDGMDLDFQEWSRTPYGGPFGAVGINGSWGANEFDVYMEAARSFDSQPEGGGWAAVLRSTMTWPKHEFEAVVRYYDKNFANPYARPISAADEYDGLRARDEAGLRLKYTGVMGDFHLRATNDFWAQLSDEAPKLKFNLRADYDLNTWLVPGVWIQVQDRDLSGGGRLDTCFETPFEQSEGEPVPCDGEKSQIGIQARFKPVRDLTITAKYQHRWLDDGSDRYDKSFRQDMAAWLTVMYKPMDELRLRMRLRYLFEGIEHNDYLEQSIWAYMEAAYWYQKTFRVKLRYELYSWLDDRESTSSRYPNPAHWIRLELEYRF